MRVTFDDSLWPLLILHYPATQSDTEYEEDLARLSGFLQRREPNFSIIDTSRVGMPNSTQRQRQVEWDREHEALVRKWGRGTAFVVTSPFVRVAMSLYFHVRPLGVPYVIVGDLGAALSWVASQMERHGCMAEAGRVRQRLQTRAQRSG